MASLLKGVTNFLETVDQKAGEIAARQQRRDDDEEYEEEEEDHETDGQEEHDDQSGHTASQVSVSSSFPVPPAVSQAESSKEPVGSRGVVSQQAHDRAMAERDARFLTLQQDYERLLASKKQLEGAAEDLQRKFEAEHQQNMANAAAMEQLRRQDDEAQVDRESLREELARLEQELNVTHQSAEAARRSYLVESESKKKLERELQQALSALADHKAQTRLLLEAKEQQIKEHVTSEQQDAAQQRVRTLEEKVETLTQDKVNAEKALLDLRKEFEKAVERHSAADAEALRAAAENKELSKKLESTLLELSSTKDLFENERNAHATTRQFLHEQQQGSAQQLQRGKLKGHDAPASPTGDALSSGPLLASSSNPSSKELIEAQRRASELAELLLEKQAALEAKRSEADQWRTRYEVSQQRLREAEMVGSSIVGVIPSGAGSRPSQRPSVSRSLFHMEEGGVAQGDTDDLRRNKFFGSLSNRGPLGKKITDVAERLDSVSLRTGGVLRRSSVLRVALIIYIAVLHLWVFVAVSLSSTLPEQAKPGSRLP